MAETVPELFLARIATSPNAEAFRVPTAAGGWESLSWHDVGERVRALACGLHALAVAAEQRCAILSGTRLEWILADLAILCAGGATTTIYPSNTPDECAFILSDSETVCVFAENDAQVAKLVAARDRLRGLKHVVTLDGRASPDGWVMTLHDLAERGRTWDGAHPDEFERRARAVRKSSLATLVYTSGTTGTPKGVELIHDCWVYEAEAIAALKLLRPDDLHYLWLPLAHVFGKVLLAAQLEVGFPTAVDGRIDKLVDNLGALHPTFVCAVPRIFEKLHNKIVTGAQEGGALRARIFQWALGIGRRVSKLAQEGKSSKGLLALQHALARRLVFDKLAARLGGRLRLFISGSAPLSRDIAEFFHAAGVLICEGYGLTESSAASVVNRPDRYRFGSVGLPLPGTELKCAQADGEILIRSRGIMRGYHRQPQATREVLDSEGWLHTGDIGHLDADGFLFITDRKKDLIKTSGGKYVAPQELENKLKALSPYVSQVLVHGNSRNFVSALVTLDLEAVKNWAGEHGLGALPDSELVAHPDVRTLVERAVGDLNAGLPSYATLKKFAIVPGDFTVEAGELTASLKPKRKVIEAKYKDTLDGFYREARASTAA